MERPHHIAADFYAAEMSARIARSKPAIRVMVLFTASLSWAFQQPDAPPPPTYQYRDPVTSDLLLCEQCPPGTAVKRHCSATGPTECQPCPEGHFADNWHWEDSCQYCTAVCKEQQVVRQVCNSTHNQLCECAPGFHLEVEFCIRHSSCQPGYGVAVPGSPLSDTQCQHCPPGSFSAGGSSSEPCRPHRDCSALGLKTLRRGTPAADAVCSRNKSVHNECSQQHTLCHNDMTLCEEAVLQSLASLRLPSLPLERLWEGLPGRRVDGRSLERLKKACSPQQQLLQLLRLWWEQNKDQDKVLDIFRGVNNCQRKVSRCNGLKNLTLDDLLRVSDSLPGVRVPQESVRSVFASCLPPQHVMQLLHLWKKENYELDLAKGLSHSLRVLRGRGAPHHLLKALRRIGRIIAAASVRKIYEKMFVGMLQDELCFKTRKPLNE